MHRTDSPRILLKDRAYEALKELILQEAFPSGTFLSERQLSQRLGMSKTPIRDGWGDRAADLVETHLMYGKQVLVAR